MPGHIPIIAHSASTIANATSSLRSLNTSSSSASDLTHGTSGAPRGNGYLKILAAILPDPPTTPRRHTHSHTSSSALFAQITPEDDSPRVQPPAMANAAAPMPAEAGSPHLKATRNLKSKRSMRFLPGMSGHADRSQSHTDLSIPPTPKMNKTRRRLTHRKMSVPQFDMMIPPGPSGSGGALALALALTQGVGAESNTSRGTQSRRLSNVPRLPELDFGIPSATPNLPALDVGALAGPQSFRCDIHSPNSSDYLAAESECKQLVIESGGRMNTLLEYLGGFLYELPALTPNPLTSGDETALGGRIVVESWTPFPEARLNGLSLNPFGGVAEVSGRQGMGGGRPKKADAMRAKLVEVGKGRDGKDRGTQTEQWVSEREEVTFPEPPQVVFSRSPQWPLPAPPIGLHQRLGVLPECDETPPRSPTVDFYEAVQIQTARRVAMKRMGFVGPKSVKEGNVVLTNNSDEDSRPESNKEVEKSENRKEDKGVQKGEKGIKSSSSEDEWESVGSEPDQ